MDLNNSNQSPIASGSQMPVTPPEPQKSGVGPIAGAIVVILLLAAGGLYFYGAKLNEKNQMQNTIPLIPGDEVAPTGGADSDTSSGLPPQSASDEAASIEADLEAMNFNEFESQTSTDVDNFDSETQ